MTTFIHKITSVKTYSKNGLNDIVHTVRYELEGESNGKKQTSFMPITFDEPNSNNFTDFSLLTEEQILSWVTEKLGQDEVDAMMNGLDSLLNELQNPTEPIVKNKELPWASNN